MALRRTKKSNPDDDLLDDEPVEAVDEAEEDDGEEDEEPEREFPRWLKPLLLVIALLIVGGVSALAGALWMKKHAKLNDIVAVINGEPIDINYLQHRMDIATGNTTAHTVAQETLLLQFAKKEGALPPEQDVDAKYKELSKDSKFAMDLFRSHQAPDDVKRSIRLNMARTALLTKNVTVTDMEAQQYYEANINPKNPNAQFFRPETVLISVIVCKNEDTIMKAANALKEGQPFAQVAGTYSEDQSKANGGQLPAIRKGQPGLEKSPELAQIIFSMKPTQQLGPKKITNAWWIIRCIDKQSALTVPFDRAHDAAYKGMLMVKGQQINGKRIQDALDAFQNGSQITVKWVTFSDAMTAKTAQAVQK